MNDQVFNKELAKISKDMRLLFNPANRLWGIYQVRSSVMTNAWGAPIGSRPWKLWDCATEDGAFRLPDRNDLFRAHATAQAGKLLWSKGGDWYSDQLENQARDRQERLDLAKEHRAADAAKEARTAMKGTKTTRLAT